MHCLRGFGGILIALLANSVSAFLVLGKRWRELLPRQDRSINIWKQYFPRRRTFHNRFPDSHANAQKGGLDRCRQGWAVGCRIAFRSVTEGTLYGVGIGSSHSSPEGSST